jgi:phosphopantothenoylcysteine decarboxylase/phosphopantothenate--cysteine ligase
MLRNKNILLGVCGSIACYKSASLIRLLTKAGANVKVIMTRDACHFITPLTLSTLSKNPVLTEFIKDSSGEWNNHVALGLWADYFVIAPISAHSIGKLANGLCDNLLSAVYLSAKCPVFFAPAMDLDMWKHPSTQKNIACLLSYGNIIIKPTNGELASGLVGEGRMAEPEDILPFIETEISKVQPLKGKRALVSAGPTYEAIDPVRFIGNHSSGKMGFCIAEELANRGAEVVLIAGPTTLVMENSSILRVDVTSAAEMLSQCLAYFENSNITIMSAAVADFRPKTYSSIKLKKASTNMDIELEKTDDILSELGKLKRSEQFLVGFALETNNEEENAIQKLKNKNLDLIVLNSLNDEGAGFKRDTNKISIIDKELNNIRFGLKTKKEVAFDICSEIINRM